MGVRADQEGVGRSVIGVGGMDVDAMLPVLGDLAELSAVGEVEEDRPCAVDELRDARRTPVGAKRQVGCEGPDQRMVVVARERVANLGARHETAEAEQWLLVDE